MEVWKEIEEFPDYSVSSQGRIRTNKSGRILQLTLNQYGLLQVGMMKDGVQRHRSVPLLVAQAFIRQPPGPFDTPINLNGDRLNNSVSNLAWRPRWFAIRYNQQFRNPYPNPILRPVVDLKTGEISKNSFECCKTYGLLERDLVPSILGHTYVWPTYQQFAISEG